MDRLSTGWGIVGARWRPGLIHRCSMLTIAYHGAGRPSRGGMRERANRDQLPNPGWRSWKLITASNAAAQAYTIAAAGAASAFQSGWYVDVRNLSTNAPGIVTVTPTTSTINSAPSIQIYPAQTVRIISDGANYQTAFWPSLPALSNSVASNVSLSNTSNYLDGPSIAQGTNRTWLVSGNVNHHGWRSH